MAASSGKPSLWTILELSKKDGALIKAAAIRMTSRQHAIFLKNFVTAEWREYFGVTDNVVVPKLEKFPQQSFPEWLVWFFTVEAVDQLVPARAHKEEIATNCAIVATMTKGYQPWIVKVSQQSITDINAEIAAYIGSAFKDVVIDAPLIAVKNTLASALALHPGNAVLKKVLDAFKAFIDKKQLEDIESALGVTQSKALQRVLMITSKVAYLYTQGQTPYHPDDVKAIKDLPRINYEEMAKANSSKEVTVTAADVQKRVEEFMAGIRGSVAAGIQWDTAYMDMREFILRLHGQSKTEIEYRMITDEDNKHFQQRAIHLTPDIQERFQKQAEGGFEFLVLELDLPSGVVRLLLDGNHTATNNAALLREKTLIDKHGELKCDPGVFPAAMDKTPVVVKTAKGPVEVLSRMAKQLKRARAHNPVESLVKEHVQEDLVLAGANGSAQYLHYSLYDSTMITGLQRAIQSIHGFNGNKEKYLLDSFLDEDTPEEQLSADSYDDNGVTVYGTTTEDFKKDPQGFAGKSMSEIRRIGDLQTFVDRQKILRECVKYITAYKDFSKDNPCEWLQTGLGLFIHLFWTAITQQSGRRLIAIPDDENIELWNSALGDDPKGRATEIRNTLRCFATAFEELKKHSVVTKGLALSALPVIKELHAKAGLEQTEQAYRYTALRLMIAFKAGEASALNMVNHFDLIKATGKVMRTVHYEKQISELATKIGADYEATYKLTELRDILTPPGQRANKAPRLDP